MDSNFDILSYTFSTVLEDSGWPLAMAPNIAPKSNGRRRHRGPVKDGVGKGTDSEGGEEMHWRSTQARAEMGSEGGDEA